MSATLADRLNHILPKITSKAFLSGEGIGNEIACYIFDYPAKDELQVREHVQLMLDRLAALMLVITAVLAGFAMLYAVRGDDDLLIRPDQLSGLSPLDENEMEKYGLAYVQSSLAYRYEAQPYEATLNVSRTEPSLTARCFSFLRIEPEGLSAHYEIVYDIRQARARLGPCGQGGQPVRGGAEDLRRVSLHSGSAAGSEVPRRAAGQAERDPEPLLAP